MWLFVVCYTIVLLYRLCPFFLFTMRTRNEYKWGSVEEVICIPTRRNNQEALFLCLQLHPGDFVYVLLYYWPEQGVSWETLVVLHKLNLLVGATLELQWLRCLWPLSERFFYYCSKVYLQWFSCVVGELLIQVLLWRWGQGIDRHPVWIGRGISSAPSSLSLSLSWPSNSSRCVGSKLSSASWDNSE